MRSSTLRAGASALVVALALLSFTGSLTQSARLATAVAAFVGNAACPGEEVFYDPGNGEDIVLPEGYKVEVFAKDLNFPTAIAFMEDQTDFKVIVLESGRGLPSRCNDNENLAFGGKFSPTNPLTPDLLVFDKHGKLLAGPIGKPTPSGGGFQADGPAIGLAFERGFAGGTLFATDSNQSLRTVGRNNSSRIVTIDLKTGTVTPFISGLPTGDHPAEQILVKDGFIYWSQGSATNSAVVGHDNGGGSNQPDIPCQDITLSDKVFDSGADGHLTSGFSPHGTARPGTVVKAFEGATKSGMCTGAILRAVIRASAPADTIEPFSWGYRNPFGIRFAPLDHPLQGGLFVTENGEDERGARPTNNAPDRLQLAQQNPDGTPDYHGWPDRFGFLDSTQSVFNPVGGPGDDNPSAVIGKPVQPVLAFPPQPPVVPLALEPADVAVVGPDFAPDSFVRGVVKRGAALVAREGDFGFSAANGRPEEGHDIQLVNFGGRRGGIRIELIRFAFNCAFADQRHLPNGAPACRTPSEQGFVAHLRGINRPVTLMFGPDGALYLVDYGAVRDFGQSDPDAKFTNPDDAPLVQIPHTGVIWRITRR